MLVFCSITKEIGVSEEIVHIWYLRCKKHGLNAFETSNKNHSYSKDFKLSKKNILVRDFKANVPNEKWLTDITEFSISGDSRKLYLSPILDLYDNSIITYEISFKNNNKLIFKMLDVNVNIKMYEKWKIIMYKKYPKKLQNPLQNYYLNIVI